MKATSTCTLTLPVALVLLLACGVEAGRPPSAPEARFTTEQADSDAPSFSDWSEPVNLGTVVNSAFVDSDPSISKDGLTLYFASGSARGGGFGGRDIWVSRRANVDDPWGPPQNLGTVINTAAHEDKPMLSPDGHWLYFASDRPGGSGDFDLYASRRRDKQDDFGWEAPVNLGSAVNTAAGEHSSVARFEDDATGIAILYFASNRAGGLGAYDIYASTQLPDGTLGPAVLVEELSTVAGDRDPAIRRDGLEMFLASNRPGTHGGLDLWVATRASTADPWSTPVNLGPAVNSPPRPPGQEQANDWGPSLSFDGTTLYFASALRPGNIGGVFFDIWVTTRSRVRSDE
jgi:Tol biopolymer transport system component